MPMYELKGCTANVPVPGRQPHDNDDRTIHQLLNELEHLAGYTLERAYRIESALFGNHRPVSPTEQPDSLYAAIRIAVDCLQNIACCQDEILERMGGE